MTFSFRIRFNQSPTDTILIESNEIVLAHDAAAAPLRLHNLKAGESILRAAQLALTGEGYCSEDAALAAGKRYQDALIVALARQRVGADFGVYAHNGGYTNHGLARLEQKLQQRVLNDAHGLMVYESEPRPKFELQKIETLRGVNKKQFEMAFLAAASNGNRLSARETVAFSLFHDSFFRQSTTSRFLLLMMAIEALLELRPRSEASKSHVKSLIAQTLNTELSKEEKASMKGALRWLEKESISQAGRHIAQQRLGGMTYKDMSASQFFTHCYGLRSELVHGTISSTTVGQVNQTAGSLELFVSDLLTSPILGVR